MPAYRAPNETIEAYYKRRELEQHGCAECKAKGKDVAMERKAQLHPGDDEGIGSTSLYQCPECKTIEEQN